MTDVLIIGAGPTGLALALWLARKDVSLRIIDKTAEPGTTSRALAVQARTLEFYDQLGIADLVVAAGRNVFGANLWVAGKRRAHLPVGDFGKDISPYSFALAYPQDQHEKMLIEQLAKLGVHVERKTELVSFEEQSDHVRARLRSADGSEETVEAKYLAGCDGAHSAVRQILGIGFEGGTYEHIFYVADVEASGPVMNGEIHIGLDRDEFLAFFPLTKQGHARLVGTVRDASDVMLEKLQWNDVAKKVIEWMHIDVEKVNWFSTYRVHHRVAKQFRRGRAFLLGDAAHVHSPVGGQGMNTGIGDAVNLGWKLVDVLRNGADPSLLDSYEPERIGFARRLVATTDQAFTAVTSSGPIARVVRLYIAPRVLPVLFLFRSFRRLMFRTVSQTDIHYGKTKRLPWTGSNFEPLKSRDWQVHVYGDGRPDTELPVHVFPKTKDLEGVYLVRPDGYIAAGNASMPTPRSA
jgi:2-polyprenyl-6-methoxyphenol hydroxylase-like FAD-dependent oxidoreductase